VYLSRYNSGWFCHNELPPQQAIENLAIEEIRPQERNDQEASKDGPNTASTENSGDSGQIFGNSRDAGEEALDQDNDKDDDDDLVQQQAQALHPRVHQSVLRDHPVDNILGSIRRGGNNTF
jgi:hypothetical protein